MYSVTAILLGFSLIGFARGQSQPSNSPSQGQRSRQLPSDPLPRTQSDEPQPEDNQHRATAPRRNPEESSSRDQIIDLSPPDNDAKDHPDSDVSDVQEFHSYDPHKAAKSVEVGDFYYKQKNYKAAIDRYREALGFKPDDAVATFHLAKALDDNGNSVEARKTYESYLKILPHGPEADKAHHALERLSKTAKASNNTPANK